MITKSQLKKGLRVKASEKSNGVYVVAKSDNCFEGVVKEYDYPYMIVQTTKSKMRGYIGDEFKVHCSYFDIIEDESIGSIEKLELRDILLEEHDLKTTYRNIKNGDIITIEDGKLLMQNKCKYIALDINKKHWVEIEGDKLYYMVTINHSVGGVDYKFIIDEEDQCIANYGTGDFVVCDTKHGQTYGKIITIDKVHMKPSEANTYKRILRYA